MAASNKLPEEEKEPWKGYEKTDEYIQFMKRQTERYFKMAEETLTVGLAKACSRTANGDPYFWPDEVYMGSSSEDDDDSGSDSEDYEAEAERIKKIPDYYEKRDYMFFKYLKAIADKEDKEKEEAEKEKLKEENDGENVQSHGVDEPSKGDINDDAVEDKKDYGMDAGRKRVREVPGPSVGEAEKKARLPVEVERGDNTAERSTAVE